MHEWGRGAASLRSLAHDVQSTVGRKVPGKNFQVATSAPQKLTGARLGGRDFRKSLTLKVKGTEAWDSFSHTHHSYSEGSTDFLLCSPVPHFLVVQDQPWALPTARPSLTCIPALAWFVWKPSLQSAEITYRHFSSYPAPLVFFFFKSLNSSFPAPLLSKLIWGCVSFLETLMLISVLVSFYQVAF